MNIKQVPAHTNNYSRGRQGQTVDRIVLHWIVGTLESADTTFQNPDRRASAHYGIGDDDVHQYVSEDDTAWHAGDFSVNLRSIGIEHEGGWLLRDGTTRKKPSEKTHETSSKLVAELSMRYGIPLDREHILKHQEVQSTQCPGTLDVDKIIKGASDIINEDMPITDQTKIPIGGEFGDIELQALRSILNDNKRDIENLRQTNNTLSETINSMVERQKETEERIQALSRSRDELEAKVKEQEETIAVLKDSINTNKPVLKHPFSRLLYSIIETFEK